MAVRSSDKLLIGAAALLLIASAGAFGTLAYKRSNMPHPPLPIVDLAGTPYTAAIAEATVVKTESWSAPVAQARGRDWIYDTFTPPEIFYNTRTRQFSVKPPTSLAEDVPEEAFGIDLVSVRPEPFPLQLIGYVGDPMKWRGTFENLKTGEVFLAGSGRAVPNLGLTIVRLDVQTVPITLADSMTTQQKVATALVRENSSGREVTITHRERHFTGTVSAMLAASEETATREVHPGDIFKLGQATYRVEKVQLSPPLVEITKESPTLMQPDRRSLTPREEEAPPEKTGPGGGS